MDFYQYHDELNISPFIKKYEGKSLGDLFPNHSIMKNEMGEFMKISWKDIKLPCDIDLSRSKQDLMENLKVIYYIGYNIEAQLKKRGIKSLLDLQYMLKYSKPAQWYLSLIEEKNYKLLYSNRYVQDIDVSFCFDLNDLLFIDIETLDLYNSPIIIIGLGYFVNEFFEIEELFIRNLEEEISMLQYLEKNILPKFKCFVSYNGKSFDIPYIINRFLYFFERNPLMNDEVNILNYHDLKYHHIDLYFNCRRKYKNQFSSYSLTNIEEKLLNFKRKNDLPSNLVGTCYRMYLENPSKYSGLIKACIEHNYWDIYSLPLIFSKLLKE
ncbi:MAG: ribonuclease H-like domain-containing protein [Promethearchaeota archaeon]